MMELSLAGRGNGGGREKTLDCLKRFAVGDAHLLDILGKISDPRSWCAMIPRSYELRTRRNEAQNLVVAGKRGAVRARASGTEDTYSGPRT